jgi:hypothetical protein
MPSKLRSWITMDRSATIEGNPAVSAADNGPARAKPRIVKVNARQSAARLLRGRGPQDSLFIALLV